MVDKLVRIQRIFLWGGGADQNKIAWIKWETVCLPKEEEGLGIKDIRNFNCVAGQMEIESIPPQ